MKFMIIGLVGLSLFTWGAAEERGAKLNTLEDVRTAYERALTYVPYETFRYDPYEDRLRRLADLLKMPMPAGTPFLQPLNKWYINPIQASARVVDPTSRLDWPLFHATGMSMSNAELTRYLFALFVYSILKELATTKSFANPILIFTTADNIPISAVPLEKKDLIPGQDIRFANLLKRKGLDLVMDPKKTEKYLYEANQDLIKEKLLDPIKRDLESNADFIEFGDSYLRLKILEEHVQKSESVSPAKLQILIDHVLDTLTFWVNLTIKHALFRYMLDLPIAGASRDAASDLDHMFNLDSDHNRFMLLYKMQSFH